MKSSLADPRTAIKYSRKVREYYLEAEKGLMVWYCPWCGVKVPKNLRHEFFDTLEQEYNIETTAFDYMDRTDIPEEFKTDEWWKKRGL